MHALTGLLTGRGRAHQSAAGLRARVLPKLLRRPARVVHRVNSGDLRIPRYVETALLGGFVAFCALYGSILGGQFHSALDRAAVAVGFGITKIEVSGNTHTRIEDVYRAIGIDAEQSLITLNAEQSGEAVADLPWVERAMLRKVYPSTLSIEVTEREPFALWQMGEAVTVVEKDGTPIGPFAANPRIASLPLVVGTGSAVHADALFVQLGQSPWLLGQTHAAIRVGDRRWDLRLKNGMTIRLPEDDLDAAVTRLEMLDIAEGVLGRDLAAIDLRLDDRTVFTMTEHAAEKRAVFVEQRIKRLEALKKQGSI
ncbi:MAG: FtsQ-type POTRA domain-containing protein [Pseudomonadota bacterium]